MAVCVSVSYMVFLLRYVDGDAVALDTARLREVTEPYVVAGGPDEGFSRLRAEDGGEADLHHESRNGAGMVCVAATHFARGAMLGVLVRLAAALGASIVPQNGGALILHEDDRRQLPSDLQGTAVVMAPTADAFQAVLDGR